jgi:hypothetical protein
MAMTLVMLDDSFKDATGIDTRKYVIIEKNLKVIK